MTDIVGTDGIHSISGLSCDLCGKECDSKVEELNFLSKCERIDSNLFHG